MQDPATAGFVEREVDAAFGRWFETWPEPLKVVSIVEVGQGVVRGLELPAKIRSLVFEAAAGAMDGATRTGDLRGALAVETRRLLNHLLTPEMEEELREAMVEALFSHIKVGEVVKKNLDTLTADDVRLMVERKAKTHLDWIRVNGAIGGFVMGTLIETVRMIGGMA